jgi:pimeloyl-ACP methyl ester carboxylesterase
MSEVVVRGWRSPLLTAGPPDETEAVVCVHGNPGSSRDWTDLVGRVGAFARVVAPDMPGFGQADKPPSFPHTVEGYGRHLGALLDALGIERAHLVLHDFGGPWGLELAAQQPERIGSLTLVNTGALLGYSWHRLARIWQTPLVGEAFMASATGPVFRRLVALENPKLPAWFIAQMWADFDRDTRRAVLRLYRATKDTDAVVERARPALSALEVPVRVIWGVTDAYIGVEMADTQLEVFPQAEVHRLEGLGHWCFVEDPERFAELAVPFLRAAVSPTAVT